MNTRPSVIHQLLLMLGDEAPVTPVDAAWCNVVLLMGFEGADASTGAPGMTDESPAAHGVGTAVGNAQIDTAQFKFGTASLLLDGVGDAVSFPDNVDWDLSNANSDQFTIELFVRFNVLAASTRYNIITQLDTVGTISFIFRVTELVNGELSFIGSTDGSTTWTVTTTAAGLTTGVWYHFAVDKDATGKVRIYVNGVMKGSSTPANSTLFNSNELLRIGGAGVSFANALNGWVDEVRITKGVARYASDSGYTVPTAAFPRTYIPIPVGTPVTLDPATIASVTLSGGNLVATNTGTTSGNQGARVVTTSAKSAGKYYFEMAFTTLANTGFNINTAVGIAQTTATYTEVVSATKSAIVYQLGFLNVGPTNYGTINQRASGDVIGIAVDLDIGRIWFRVAPSGPWNGNDLNNPYTNVGGAPLAALTYPLAPICCYNGTSGTSGNVTTANFGATNFVGVVPCGFTAGWPV